MAKKGMRRGSERRVRKVRLDFRKLLFVLPNLFTLSSIFCGFYAITLCSGETTGDQLYRASLMIFFASFFDAFDGRVARLTRTQSEFGMELDSLSDLVSFGVAPGLLAYKWGLAPLGTFGVLCAFAFPACGALRLARFNVLAKREGNDGQSKFFVGLPIPVGAVMLISLVIAHHKSLGGPVIHHGWVAALVLILSGLMVSNIRYHTFKGVGLSKRSATVFLLVIAVGVTVALKMRASFALVGYVGAYIGLGFLEEILFFRTRRAERMSATVDVPAGTEEVAIEELAAAEEDDEVFS